MQLIYNLCNPSILQDIYNKEILHHELPRPKSQTPENAMSNRNDHPRKMRIYHKSICRILPTLRVVSRLFRRCIVSVRLFLEFEAEVLELIGSHEIPIRDVGPSQQSAR